MPRQLDTGTLDAAARNLAGEFLRPGRKGNSDRWIGGREFVLQELFNYTYKDAHEHIITKIKGFLGPDALVEFAADCAAKLTPRDDAVFHALLADNLAIDPAGNHLPGKLGRIEIGRRKVGRWRPRRGGEKDATWPVYAGEDEERAAGSDKVDALPAAGSVFVGDEHLR